jgi:hypothetical protein
LHWVAVDRPGPDGTEKSETDPVVLHADLIVLIERTLFINIALTYQRNHTAA